MKNTIPTIGTAAIAAYLTLASIASSACAAPPAPNPAQSNLEQKVIRTQPGLVTQVPTTTLASGMYQGKYRAEGEAVYRNSGPTMPGPMWLKYSLCLRDYDMCVDGKAVKIENGLKTGEVVRQPFVLRMRTGGDITWKGRVIPQKDARFKVNTMVGIASEFHEAYNFLPPTGDYICKPSGCPTK